MLSREPSLSILAHNTTHSLGLSLSLSLCLSLSLSLSHTHTYTHTHTVPSPLVAHPHTHLAAAPWSSHQASSCVCRTCPPQPTSPPRSPSGDSNSQRRACPARSLPWTHPRRHCENAPTPSGYRSIWPRTTPAQSWWRNDPRTCPAPWNVLWEQKDLVILVGFHEGADVMATNEGCPSTGGPWGLPLWLHRHPSTTTPQLPQVLLSSAYSGGRRRWAEETPQISKWLQWLTRTLQAWAGPGFSPSPLLPEAPTRKTLMTPSSHPHKFFSSSSRVLTSLLVSFRPVLPLRNPKKLNI